MSPAIPGPRTRLRSSAADRLLVLSIAAARALCVRIVVARCRVVDHCRRHCDHGETDRNDDLQPCWNDREDDELGLDHVSR